MNTPGTKAVVGFAEGKEQPLGDVRITSDCPYASIVLTARGQGVNARHGQAALLTAVARTCNSGFRYFTPDKKILENGKGPILMEPVKAIPLARARDQAGQRARPGRPARRPDPRSP